jgi:hypothetical protein
MFLWLKFFIDYASFESCRASALGVLCQIFCCAQFNEFSDLEVSRFYDLLIVCLNDSSDKLIVLEIIKNCAQIFSSQLSGCRILIPSFMPHIKRIFDKSASPLQIQARSSALKMIGSLLSIKYAFSMKESHSDSLKLLSINFHHLQSLSFLLCSIINNEK